MSEVVSVTVPNDAKCIEKARDFLAEMAALAGQSAGSTTAGPATPSAPPAPPAGQSEESGASAPPPPPAGGQPEESSTTAPPPPPSADGQSEESSATAPEVDADGLPWDERIHASTKKKTQDGRWKKKRGVDGATREAVEMQLKHQAGLAAGNTDSDESPSAMSFAEFMAELKTKNPSYESIEEALQAAGLSELPELATQPDKVRMVYDKLFGGHE